MHETGMTAEDFIVGWCADCHKVWRASDFEGKSYADGYICPDCGELLLEYSQED